MVKIPRSIVPIIGESDIDESYIRQQDVVLLKTLLIDRTMTALNRGVPVNIKWAVDDYANEYPDKAGCGCEEQITLDAISSRGGRDLKVVTPRVRKRKEEQERRTAQKAEVFTPSWICNEQNNLVDEAWFERKDFSISPILTLRRASILARTSRLCVGRPRMAGTRYRSFITRRAELGRITSGHFVLRFRVVRPRILPAVTTRRRESGLSRVLVLAFWIANFAL